MDTGDVESAFGHLLLAGDEAAAFEMLRRSLVDAFLQGDGRVLHRLAAKVGTVVAGAEAGRLVDLALALAASAPAGQAAPWIVRGSAAPTTWTTPTAPDSFFARALVAVQYGEAAEVEQALVDHLGPKDLPDDEVAEYGPTLLARAPAFGSAIFKAHARSASKTCVSAPRQACSRSR